VSAVAGLGKPIKGPSALGSDRQRFWQLTRALAVTDFKLRFFGSALGYLWQLMRPLLLFGVLLLVFTKIARFGDVVPHYAEGLLLGIVLFTFFSESTGGAVTSLVNRESLVRKIEFPRLAVPMSVVLQSTFNLALNMVAVMVFVLASGVSIRWTWLELPLIVAAIGVLATGISMLLSAAFVRYRDVSPIWDVLTQVLFYGSGVFFSFETISTDHKNLANAMALNPIGALLQQARHALLGPAYATAPTAAGGWGWLLIPIGITVLLFVWGFVYFDRQAPRIAEEL
jgi:ABC-2 type transport system permease protein